MPCPLLCALRPCSRVTLNAQSHNQTLHSRRSRHIPLSNLKISALHAHSFLSRLSFTLKRLSHPLRHCTCPLTTAECCRLKLPSTIALLQSRFGLSGLESPIRHRPEISFALQEGRSARHPLFTMTDMLDNRCSIEPIGETLTVTARRRRRSWCARCMSNGSARPCNNESQFHAQMQARGSGPRASGLRWEQRHVRAARPAGSAEGQVTWVTGEARHVCQA